FHLSVLISHSLVYTSYPTPPAAFLPFTPPPSSPAPPLSLHDALPISLPSGRPRTGGVDELGHLAEGGAVFEVVGGELLRLRRARSEEHTSEFQSPYDLVCRLLLEKKKKKQKNIIDVTMMTTTYNTLTL